MCGRFALYAAPATIQSKLKLTEPVDIAPNYNITPSSPIIAVIDGDNGFSARYFHWGLIPFWAKDKKNSYRMINARAETLTQKPAFKQAFKTQRCIIVMSGFFEWKTMDGHKQPYFIYPKQDDVFKVAGIWQNWTDKASGEIIESCAIITCEANLFMKAIHHRMPAIIANKDYDNWLAKDNQDTSYLQTLLNDSGQDDLSCHAVTTNMNDARFNDKKIIEPLK